MHPLLSAFLKLEPVKNEFLDEYYETLDEDSADFSLKTSIFHLSHMAPLQQKLASQFPDLHPFWICSTVIKSGSILDDIYFTFLGEYYLLSFERKVLTFSLFRWIHNDQVWREMHEMNTPLTDVFVPFFNTVLDLMTLIPKLRLLAITGGLKCSPTLSGFIEHA